MSKFMPHAAVVLWLAGGSVALAQVAPAPVAPRPAQPVAVAQEAPRPGKLVTVEVVIADLGAEGTGAAALTVERVLELEKKGMVEAITRLRLSSLENSKAHVQIGERVPRVTGRSIFGGSRAGGARRGAADGVGGFGGAGGNAGGASVIEAAPGEPADAAARRTVGQFVNSFSFDNVGTVVTVVPRVEEDGSILMEIEVEKSRNAPAGAAGPEPDATGLVPDRTLTISARTALRVGNGKTVILSGQDVSAKSTTRTCILVTASADGGPAATAEATLKMFHLRNAQADETADVLRKLFQDDAFSLGVDERTNTLTVRGKPDRLAEIEAIVANLDASK